MITNIGILVLVIRSTMLRTRRRAGRMRHTVRKDKARLMDLKRNHTHTTTFK